MKDYKIRNNTADDTGIRAVVNIKNLRNAPTGKVRIETIVDPKDFYEIPAAFG